jgi:spermidine/putrescine transport system permease protein
MTNRGKSKNGIAIALTCGPGILWIVGLLVLPFVAIVLISFLSPGDESEFQLPWTLEQYRRLAGFGSFGFDPVYALIFFRSLILATVTALLCLVLGVPLAFFIAGMPGKWKSISLTLVILPFWINLLIRTYAWQILLGPDTFLSNLALSFHLIEDGDGLYPSLFAVYLGNLCDYLPYFVLPLYTSVEKIDWRLAEAAMDLGAGKSATFIQAVLPQIIPGLAAGTLLVFVPALGQFVIPDLLGGAKTALLGNSIGQQFGASRNWPLGSAISVGAMLVVMIGLWIYAQKVGEKGQESLL